MNPPPEHFDHDADRRRWLDGERATGKADEFARHADRGRAELGSAKDAEDLLTEMDGLFNERFMGADAGATKVGKQPVSPPRPVEKTTRRGGPLRPIHLYLVAAATVLLLIAAAYWWGFPDSGQDDNAHIYAETFEPYPNDISRRTMGDPAATDISPLLAEALRRYDRGEYRGAADSFAAHLKRAPASAPNSTLYYGISLLESGKYEEAAAQFASLTDDPNYGQAAMWYWALTDLRNGKTDEARRRLTTVANDATSLFRSRAEILLTKLAG